MKKQIMILLLAMATILGCSSTPPPVPATDSTTVSPDTVVVPIPPTVSLVDSLLTTLSPDALAGQMIVVYRVENDFLLRNHFGGVLLFKSMLKDPDQLKADMAALQADAPLGYFVCLDQEGGSVSRLDAIPGWEEGTPGAVDMATWPVDSVQAEGRRIGLALADLGVNLNLAPVLDRAQAWDGSQGWMGRRRRAFGSSDDEILPPARAFSMGCREAGVACLAKHFPGYDVAENSDLEPARSGADSAAIMNGVSRFAAAADVVSGVMMSSIIYPPLGEEPAVLNPRVVGLARLASPGGLVMTDDLWGTALRAWQRPDLQILPTEYPEEDWAALVERALFAGNDLLLVTYPAKAVRMRKVLVKLMAEDPQARQRVVEAVRRILEVKVRMELFDTP